jgi:hypothetical protein
VFYHTIRPPSENVARNKDENTSLAAVIETGMLEGTVNDKKQRKKEECK